MENHKAQSFKPLAISAENLPASMAQQENLTNYAAERAELLFGCYRTGDANDPGTYVAAITATLSRYPAEVITEVTNPKNPNALPNRVSWLPSVKEVFDACETAVGFIRQHEARLKRIKEQMETREREDRGEKPTIEQLKAKYGEGWGLQSDKPKPKDWVRAPTLAELQKFYAEHPERIARLLKSDLEIEITTTE